MFFIFVVVVLERVCVAMPRRMGILVPWLGIEPVAPALEAQSLNYWTTRDVPVFNVSIMHFWDEFLS